MHLPKGLKTSKKFTPTQECCVESRQPKLDTSAGYAGYLLLAVNVINYVDIDKDKEPDMFQKRSFNLILRVFIM